MQGLSGDISRFVAGEKYGAGGHILDDSKSAGGNAAGQLFGLLFIQRIGHGGLDETRREALFGEILGLGIQAWMTGTDSNLFAPLKGEAQFFGVNNAVITPV